MSIKTVLSNLRAEYTNIRDLGTAFETLTLNFLKTDNIYKNLYKNVWTFKEFVISHSEYGLNEKDKGVDLVAEFSEGEKRFCAIQCKVYEEGHKLVKEDIDSFFTESGKKIFTDRLLVVTTNSISDNVSESLSEQTVPVSLITLEDLENSSIDWLQFDINKIEKLEVKPKKTIRPHQKEALEKAVEYFKYHDRGKLIMACGTGKTYTSLKIAEAITPEQSNILFLVPSISLLSQTLKEWNYEAENPINSYAVCSDVKIGKDEDLRLHELSFPATTDADKLLENFKSGNKNGRTVIFSTYQSLDVIQKAQSKGLPEFDFVICDEAHRTTGVIKGPIKDDSNFVMIHDNDKIKAKKRMYMTATPRIYTSNVKTKANKKDIVLCSMDEDSKIYGETIYKLSFSKAVELDLLSDYQVMVYMVSQDFINEDMQSELAKKDSTLNLGDLSKLTGCYNGLAKKSIDDSNIFTDTNPMKRAVMFAGKIEISKKIAKEFKKITQNLGELKCEAEHIDGTTNIIERNERIGWLKEPVPEGECRILSNARCLSEGVDIPALDAVIFLNPKDSEIDIIQAVGRAMRKSEGKKFGYIILPVAIPINKAPEDVLKETNYNIVWNTLESLRAHDDQMDRTINQLKYNGESDRIHIIGTGVSIPKEQLNFDFPEDKIKMWKDAIMAKIVEKCGDKEYLLNWTKDIIDIMNVHIARINEILKQNANDRKEFDIFLDELRQNISPVISEEDAIIMLSQHLITKPVFETLFDSDFVKINPISLAMDKIINLLDEKGLKNETKKLERFYESVEKRVSAIKNPEDKQKVIIELYDNFFSLANPKSSDKYGIVYTPVEIVDFIVNSVEHVLNEEFGTKLENEDVHILDPFTGTGTFITRLLHNGIIAPDKLENKYKKELHANEIMLLAYYIAAINIEETYKNITGKYEPFTGIVLTDTFQMLEEEYKSQAKQMVISVTDEETFYPLKRNSKRALKQKRQDIRVIIGNPPYSAKQDNANDDNKADKYPKLDEKIVNTYVKNSTAQLKQSLHDSYIRAFRWATDRIKDKGVICYISNNSYINGKALDGFRKSLLDEFSSVYCFNLKGNFRAYNAEEGENVFGNKCGTGVAITLLVKNPDKAKNNKIFYYEIPEKLKTDEKLNYISSKKDITAIKWQEIIPNESHDWIKKRNPVFSEFIPMGDKTSLESKTIFKIYSGGLKTQRDSWCYNFSKEKLENNVKSMIEFYNGEVDRYGNAGNIPKNIDSFVNNDPTKISWTRGLKNRLKSQKKLEFNNQDIVAAVHRPFCKQWLYYNGTRELNEEISQMPKIFPDKNSDNLLICVNGIGDKTFSSVIVNNVPDLQILFNSQAFPLYYYEKTEDTNNSQQSLFHSEPLQEEIKYTKKDNISDEFLKEIRDKYHDASINKEDIFYYIYGILHNEDYKKTFANDLTKMLPRIPFIAEFKDISKYGRELANLHIHYENIEPYPVTETISKNPKDLPEKELYRIEKMKFGRKGKDKDKTVIIYNEFVTLSNIPLESYDYIVNGRSAIEWIMNRYQVNIDKNSLIKNDLNIYLEEINDYKYIVNLIKKIINVSIKSVNIIKEISKYKIVESESAVESLEKYDDKAVKSNVIDFPAKFDVIPDDDVPEEQKFVEYLPVYSLEAAASKFSGEQYVERLGWKSVKNLNYLHKLYPDMFIAKVVGKSMEPTIPDGSYCIFRFEPQGSRDGKVVLAESRLVSDHETNQKFTVKRYRSEKEYSGEDGLWSHKRIILSPDNKDFEDIILENASENDFKIVAEFISVV
jgi:predicted helicase